MNNNRHGPRSRFPQFIKQKEEERREGGGGGMSRTVAGGLITRHRKGGLTYEARLLRQGAQRRREGHWDGGQVQSRGWMQEAGI